MGRIVGYQEYLEGSNGTAVIHNRYGVSYDLYDRVTADNVSQWRGGTGGGTSLAQNTNAYAGAGGALTLTTTKNWFNGNDGNAADTRISYTLEWADGSRVTSSSYDSDTASTSNPLYSSAYGYDGLGRTAKVTISDFRPRTVSFANTLEGQVLLRKERSAAAADPEDRHYFAGGIQQGEITNNGNNDPDRVDWNQSILTKTWQSNTTPAPFRWNTTGGVTAAQMGAGGYDPLSATGQGMSGTDGRHTVRAGDTLASIAAARWGDASLWYVLAQANGLSANAALAAGQSLIVPDKVISNTNNASTFRPYDAAHAMGDLSPTTTKPPKPKSGGCGIIGAILLVVVAIAVVAILKVPVTSLFSGTSTLAGGTVTLATGATLAVPAVTVSTGLTALGSIAVGATLGAAGALASGVVGKITGIQPEFSWKSVALGALSGGIAGGLGQVGGLASLGLKGTAGAVARGMVASAVTQIAGKLTGLQDKISWAGVAGAGIGVGLAQQLGSGLGALDSAGGNSLNNHLAHLGVSGASMLANAATRSILEGTDFGDNVLAALPDVIAQTVFDLARFGVVGKPRIAYDMTGLLGDDAVMATAASAPEGNAGGWRSSGDYGDRMHYKGGGERESSRKTANSSDLPFVPQDGYYSTIVRPDGSRERIWSWHDQKTAAEYFDNRVGQWGLLTVPMPESVLINRRQSMQKMAMDSARETGDAHSFRLWRDVDIMHPRFSSGQPVPNSWLDNRVHVGRPAPEKRVTTSRSSIAVRPAQPRESSGADIVVSGQNIRPSWTDATPLAVTRAEQSFTQPSFDLGMLAAPQFDYHSPFGTSVVTNAINHSISAANRQATGGSGSGIGLELASATASFVPVLGTALGFYSLATGKDLITGKSVSRGEAAFGILLSAVPFGSIITKGKKFAKIGGEVAERIDDGAAAGRRIDEMVAAERGLAVEARGGAYVLRDAEGSVARSGRSGNLAQREAQHNRDPLLKDYDFDPVYRTDVYAEQRGLEKILHDTYQPPLDKIRPISPTNSNRQIYIDAAQKYLGGK